MITMKNENIEDIKAEIAEYIACFRLYLLYTFQIMNFRNFRRNNVIF